MGILGNLFKGSNASEPVNEAPLNMIKEVESHHVEATPGKVLNLTKGGVLDLTKQAPSLVKMRVAAGWDMARVGRDFDLDLCALLLDENGRAVKRGYNTCVYYGDKNTKGMFLDGDNLTGEGDGDDENIYVTLPEVPADTHRIVFAVVIYQGASRRQHFSGVKNAFVRLVDVDAGEKEVCRYNLTEDGGKNTAVVFAELFREGNGWNFKAIGEYYHASIADLKNMYARR